MKMTKKAITLSLGLVVMGSASFAQSLADAKKAIDAEQYQKATTMLKALVKSQASKGENYFSLGDVYLRRDYLDSARAAFTQGITADPKNALNYVGLGQADLISNNAASAKTNFDKAIEVASRKDFTPYLYIGKAYLSTDKPDFAAALPNLQKAEELDANDKEPETFVALGDYYALQKKNSEALQNYMRALSINSALYRSTVQIGRMYKESRAFTDAEAELKPVVAADPNYGPAYRELAELYMQWANQEPQNFDAKAADALTNYKKYLDLTDKSYDSRLRYAQFLFYARDFKGLEQETSELATINPNDPKNLVVLRLRGYSAYENKNYPQSLQYMKDFFAKVKDTSRIQAADYLYLGRAQLQAQDSSALKNVIKSVEMDSTNVEALADIAKSYFEAKDYPKAISTYEIVNRINPAGKGSLYNYYYYGTASYFYYGKAYNAKLNPSKDILVKADSAFAKLAQLSPSTIDAYLWRARINYFKDSDTDPQGLAVPFYQQYADSASVYPAEKQTAAIKKNMVEAYNSIAGFAFSKNDKVKAKLFWDKALAIDPNSANALEGIKSLTAAPARAAGKK
ncbi:tetratricopeptide repeat protein [Pedobacter metabolipauper]|uniref:Tetratricopeptide repeat protein n=1 Tax=Pedobacter metabolipauper TaxID=425513 RepID=A0A4R6SYN8_9SPHI|nr:tetratricopeptide repeat protein [Pedobacter metabolipauper]TDQ09802.1 tetratricopeptide repeat protein [Pedobacter metabolipauper]